MTTSRGNRAMHKLVTELNEASCSDEMRREASEEIWQMIFQGQPNTRYIGCRVTFRGGTVSWKDWMMPFWFRPVRHERHNHALPE